MEEIEDDPASVNTFRAHRLSAATQSPTNESWRDPCSRYFHTSDLLDDIELDDGKTSSRGECDDDEEVPLWISTSTTNDAPWQPTHRHIVKRFASWKDSKADPGVREEAERLLEGFATPEKRVRSEKADSYNKERVAWIGNREDSMNATLPPQKPRTPLPEVRPGQSRFPEPASALKTNTSDCFAAQVNYTSTIWSAYPCAGFEQRRPILTQNSPCRILPEGPFRLSKTGTLRESRFGDLWRQMRGPTLVALNAKMMSRRSRNDGHPIRELIKGSVAEERGNKAVAHSVIGQERWRGAEECAAVKW